MKNRLIIYNPINANVSKSYLDISVEENNNKGEMLYQELIEKAKEIE